MFLLPVNIIIIKALWNYYKLVYVGVRLCNTTVKSLEKFSNVVCWTWLFLISRITHVKFEALPNVLHVISSKSDYIGGWNSDQIWYQFSRSDLSLCQSTALQLDHWFEPLSNSTQDKQNFLVQQGPALILQISGFEFLVCPAPRRPDYRRLEQSDHTVNGDV